MTPETLKNKLAAAFAPREAKLSKDGDAIYAQVTLPNNSAFYGGVPISDNVDFADLAAQCEQAEAQVLSDTLFLMRAKEIGGYEYNGNITEKGRFKHAVVPEGVEKIEDVFSTAGFGTSAWKSLESVALPQSLKILGNRTFHYCTSLKSIDLPKGIEVIGKAAFEQCESLISIVIPDLVKALPDNVFRNCKVLTDVTLSNGLVEISDGCFDGCVALKHITLPHSIQSLGTHPFSGCNELADFETDRFVLRNGMLIDKETHTLLTAFDCEHVVVPEGITAIGEYAFWGCRNLESVTLPSTLTKIEESAFACNHYDQICNKLQSIVIPEGVTEIPYGAFEFCRNLESVTFPASVTKIGDYAFHGCEKLRDIALPSALVELGMRAFEECSSLTSIDIPDGVSVIEIGTFSGCKLTTIKLPAELAEIEERAFEGAQVSAIVMPDKVKKIGESAFAGASNLKRLDLPASVKNIGDSAFDGCTSLTFVSIANKDINIGTGAFYNCPVLVEVELPKGLSWSKLKTKFKGSPWGENGAGKTADKHAKEKKLSEMREMSIEAMARGIFAGCEVAVDRQPTKLTFKGRLANGCFVAGVFTLDPKKGFEQIDWETIKSAKAKAEASSEEGTAYVLGDAIGRMGDLLPSEKVTQLLLPDGLTELCDEFAEDFKSLKSVNIPESVTEIGWGAFSGCSSLKSINIPESVTEIKGSAFDGCSSLEEVDMPAGVTEFSSDTFKGCRSLKRLSIPSVTIMHPTSLTGCDYKNLKLESKQITLTPEGLLIDNDFQGYPWDPVCSAIFSGMKTLLSYYGDATDVVVPDGIEALYDELFDGNSTLRSVRLPASLKMIGRQGFSDCNNLILIDIPKGVEVIEGFAFSGCTSLASITLPKCLKTLGRGAFRYCSALENVVIPEGMECIESQTFSGCTSLKSIDLPNSVKTIDPWAFADCSSLESVSLPGVETIEGSAFAECTALKHISLGSAVLITDPSSFKGCDAVTDIDLPEGLTWGKLKARFKNAPWGQTKPAPKAAAPGEKKPLAAKSEKDIRTLTLGAAMKKTFEPYEIVLDAKKAATQSWETPFTYLHLTVTLPNGCFIVVTIAPFDKKAGSAAIDWNLMNSIKRQAEECITPGTVFVYCDGKLQWNDCEKRRLNDILDMDKVKHVVFANGVTTVNTICKGCIGVASIKIPDGVTVIGSDAFYGCKGLTSIVIPNGVTEIGRFAFDGCTGLTSIEIPDSVKEIGESAFYGCKGLSSIKIPNGVTEIGSRSFDGCTGLTSIEIPDSVTKIDNCAFRDCTSLKEITLPKSLRNLAEDAFSGMDLTGVTTEAGNHLIVDGALYDKPNKKLRAIIRPLDSVTTFDIPDWVKKIGVSAFMGCTNLKSIVLPEGVDWIGESAFRDCTNLESVVLPESLNTIKDGTFCGCKSLKSIVLPESVKALGYYAFGKSGLEKVVIKNPEIKIDGAFLECTGIVDVELPAGLTWGKVKKYFADSPWSKTQPKKK